MREVILKHTQDLETWQMIKRDLEDLPPYERHRILQQSQEAKQNAESFNAKLLNHLISLGPDAEYDSAPLDPTWRRKAWKHVEDLCDENLHDIWVRLLAQEIKHTGSCSLHTMDLLSRLSTVEAHMIDHLSAFVIVNDVTTFLALDWYKEYVSTIEHLDTNAQESMNTLGDIGILRHIDGMFAPSVPIPDRRQEWKIGSITFDVVPHDMHEGTWHLHGRLLTSSGAELCNICEYQPNSAYLKQIIAEASSHGFEITPK